uniref:NADH dehydrogenase subunit 6 n=1 Tax=Eoneureclipsis hainanensis TaxID=3043990 RepID=UPI002551D45C|nr:NADH dehydrogenase subunit 6 [Eoneureclipsis hainanensis]WGT74392.1 NADH dehydrogenase subunit 6 [Eoneureclipsis hainanensis]
MNTLFLSFFILINSIFILIKHPMTLNLIIFLQLLNSCFIMNSMIKTPWFSYILFIMFIGGLMILFLYMCSVTSNLKFKMNFNKQLMMLILFSFIMLTFINFKNSFMWNKISNIEYSINHNYKIFFNTYSFKLFKLFNSNSLFLTLLIIHMLFFMLIFLTQMIKNFQGPMRKMY